MIPRVSRPRTPPRRLCSSRESITRLPPRTGSIRWRATTRTPGPLLTHVNRRFQLRHRPGRRREPWLANNRPGSDRKRPTLQAPDAANRRRPFVPSVGVAHHLPDALGRDRNVSRDEELSHGITEAGVSAGCGPPRNRPTPDLLNSPAVCVGQREGRVRRCRSLHQRDRRADLRRSPERCHRLD